MFSEKGRHDFLNADTEFSPEALPRLEKRRWRWLGNKDLIISIRILGYQMLPMPKSPLPPRHLWKSYSDVRGQPSTCYTLFWVTAEGHGLVTYGSSSLDANPT